MSTAQSRQGYTDPSDLTLFLRAIERKWRVFNQHANVREFRHWFCIALGASLGLVPTAFLLSLVF